MLNEKVDSKKFWLVNLDENYCNYRYAVVVFVLGNINTARVCWLNGGGQVI